MQSSTLKGIFALPKMNHRRDFLRENKLNLRELEKNTTQKLTQQKVDHEKQQRKHLQRYQRSREHSADRRSVARSDGSQQRYNGYNGEDLRQGQSHRAPAGTSGAAVEAVKPNRVSYRRSYSLQRENQDLQPPCAAATVDKCNNNKHLDEVKSVRLPPRSASVTSMLSKAESCDKEIQTEDILDEEFLYDALKKCTSTELGFRNKHIQEDDHYRLQSNAMPKAKQFEQDMRYEDNKSTHSKEHIQYEYRDRAISDDNKSLHEQYSERSDYHQHMHNGLSDKDNQYQKEDEHLEDQMQQLYINPHAQRESEALSSARSRQTTLSTVSKKKANENYKMGNREDLRLPRYLEKEKREKQEERTRELARDPNCPLGHYAMAEKERLAALNAAQERMAALIQELNRMPMTTETLRVRTRKAEIDKELQRIDLDIRTFSKPKVYVSSSAAE